jgi:hypothetical protein
MTITMVWNPSAVEQGAVLSAGNATIFAVQFGKMISSKSTVFSGAPVFEIQDADGSWRMAEGEAVERMVAAGMRCVKEAWNDDPKDTVEVWMSGSADGLALGRAIGAALERGLLASRCAIPTRDCKGPSRM